MTKIMWQHCIAGTAGVVLLTSIAAYAEAPASGAAPDTDKLKIGASLRSRLDVWNFFEPTGAAGANNTYAYSGNTLHVNGLWKDDWFEVFVDGQGVLLGGLPDNSIGTPVEGPLGLGGAYRANNHDESTQASFYLRQANLKLKNLGVEGLTLKGGRQVFVDGKEVMPTDPSLAWLRGQRVAERLIGPFDFTYAGRSFDSALTTYVRDGIGVVGFYGKPTQGGFNIDGMDQIDEINLAYGSVNLNDAEYAKNTSARLFYVYYDDNRALLKVDNRALAARQADTADIAIHTIGADVLQLVPTGIGPVDLVGWFSYQAGDWGQLDHSAWALAIEAGLQPKDLPWKPWIRAGFNMGSGDDDAGDGDHESFFQLMPTPRPYALSTLYNMMNTEDIFAQVVLKPIAGMVWRTDLHVMRLSEEDDLWYFGGGATREKRNVGFGYGGRPSGGNQDLMEVLETQLNYTWNDYVATSVYYGHAFGEDAVGSSFTNRDADYAYFEVTLTLPPM